MFLKQQISKLDNARLFIFEMGSIQMKKKVMFLFYYTKCLGRLK